MLGQVINGRGGLTCVWHYLIIILSRYHILLMSGPTEHEGSTTARWRQVFSSSVNVHYRSHGHTNTLCRTLAAPSLLRLKNFDTALILSGLCICIISISKFLTLMKRAIYIGQKISKATRQTMNEKIILTNDINGMQWSLMIRAGQPKVCLHLLFWRCFNCRFFLFKTYHYFILTSS